MLVVPVTKKGRLVQYVQGRSYTFVRPKIENREKQQGKHGKYPKKLRKNC